MIRVGSLKQFNIKWLPIETQKHIVKRIEYLELDIVKMKHLLQQMKQLLQKALNYAFCNLDDFEPKIMQLGENCNILVGKTPPTKDKTFWDDENGHNWLTIRDITNKNFSTERKISDKATKLLKFHKTKNEDLLFCFIGTLKLLLSPKEGYYFNQAIAILKPNEDILLKKYLMYYLKTKIDDFKRTHKNTILVCLSKKVISELYIPTPSIQTQQKIINFIHPLYTKLETLIDKTNNLIKTQEQLIMKITNSLLNKELKQ